MPPFSAEYMYRVMKFNNFALPKEVGEGWGCVFRGGGNPKNEGLGEKWRWSKRKKKGL